MGSEKPKNINTATNARIVASFNFITIYGPGVDVWNILKKRMLWTPVISAMVLRIKNASATTISPATA